MKDTITLTSKMFIIRMFSCINIDNLSLGLKAMNKDKLFIFVVNDNIDTNIINQVSTKNDTKVIYMEMNSENFRNFLNENDRNFLEYNKYSMFIIRNSRFMDIKNLFSSINNINVLIGIGRSQKSHGLSPLDIRLSSYIMAMFNFDYKYISNLNIFNSMNKDRYLSWTDKTEKGQRSILYKEFKPIFLNKMPTYCNNRDLGQYSLECMKVGG